MTKREFFDALTARMKSLPKEEQNRVIRYYNEVLEDYMEDGMSEEEAVAQLEDVDVIAKRILLDYAVETHSKPPVEAKPAYNAVKYEKQNKALILVLALITIPIWGSVLISLLSAVFSIAVSLFCIPVSLGASAIGCIIMTPVLIFTGQVGKGFLVFGAALICTALTLVSIPLIILLLKLCYKFVRWMLGRAKAVFSKRKAAM